MCVAIAKYFKETGWVVAKNRDQDYVSTVSFVDSPHPSVGEILLLNDHDTGYREGMNYNDMFVITTSLTPDLADETDKEDGALIEKALKMKTPEQAANFLVKNKLVGCLFIGTSEKLIMIEAGATGKDKAGYEAIKKVISKNEIICRTNHGVWLPWAGFQYGVDEAQDMWRKSSETRLKLAEKAAVKANTPEDLLERMAQKYVPDLQMNIFRVENKPRQMRTIFQWALVPKKNEVVVRPIQCRMKVDISVEMVKIKFLDNEIIRKIYDGRVKHFSKMEVDHDKQILKTVVEKNLRPFMAFAN